MKYFFAMAVFFQALVFGAAHAAPPVQIAQAGSVNPAATPSAPTPPTPPTSVSVSPKPSDRFADIPGITLDTPAFAPNKKDFTTEAELQSFIARRVATSPTVSWRSLGKTQGGRELHLLVLTQDGRGDPQSVAANRKPTVWIIAQQHGDEPAGAEAALELLRRLTSTELRTVLDKINVVVMPRANPDGAAGFKRTTARGDMNRDHLLGAYIESQAMHRALNAYPPTVVVDAHEFTAAGRWVERYGGAQASDVLVQTASHPGVAEGLRKLGKDLIEPALNATWAQYGLKSHVYHTLNIAGNTTFVQMGGNFAGIGRNALGLLGAVSYLIESRGVGIGRDHYPRRVASHVLSMVTILRTAATHADALRAASRESKRAAVAGTDWLVDFEAQREPRVLPLFDPVTGEDKAVTVDFQNSLLITPTLSRPVPLGYMLPAAFVGTPLVAKLQDLGLTVHKTIAPIELEIEHYQITQFKQEPGEFGAPIDKLSTQTRRAKKLLETGSIWIPITAGQQPLWRMALVVLEPDGVGSFASYRLMSGEPVVGQELPLLRVVGGSNVLIAPVLPDLH